MYWKILVNLNDLFDFIAFAKRFDDEARMKFRSINPGGDLSEIVVYDVEAIWYKNMDPNTGTYTDRCNDDVIQEIQDSLHRQGHDVIGCQRHEGTP